MTSTHKRIERPIAFAAISLLSISPLLAQDDSEEEIFELSPFQVDGSQDEGYRGAATTAGSRLSTQLKDVAASITPLTNVFLDDLGANDLSEALTMVAGADTDLTADVSDVTSNGEGYVSNDSNEREGSVRVRGLGRAVNTLNYVQVNTSLDRYNISRAEFLRGPNAILFGLGEAAGIVNYAPNQALLGDDINKVAFKVDQYGSLRFNFDVSRVIKDDVLAVRVNGLDSSEKYMYDNAYWDDRRLFVTAKYKPLKNTTLNVGWEDIESSGRRPNYTLPQDQSSAWLREFNAAHAEAAANGGMVGGYPIEEFLDRNLVWDPVANSVGNNSGNVAEALDLLSDRGGFLFEPEESPIRRNLDGGSVDLIAAFDGGTLVDNTIFRAEARKLNGGGPSTGPTWKYNEDGSRAGRWPGDQKVSHRRKLGQSADPKDGVNKAFTDPQVLDETIFPYLDVDLSSVTGNMRTVEDRKLFLNFEQKINEDFYIQGTYQNEDYATYTRNVISNAHRQIAIDINRRTSDGRSNPNYLRPYLSGREDERISNTQSENFVLQASYDLDFAKRSDRFAFLGRHQISGLFSKTGEDVLSYTQRPVIINNDVDTFDQLDLNASDVNFRRIRQLWYIGDAVQPGDTSIKFTGLPSDVSFDPSKYSNAQYAYYSEKSAAAAANLANSADNNGIIEQWEVFNSPLQFAQAVDDSASYKSRNVSGAGITLQSSLFNGRLATIFGVRRDSLDQFEHTQMTADQFAAGVAGHSSLEALTAARERQAAGYDDDDASIALQLADRALTDEADRLKWVNGSQSPEHFVIQSDPTSSFQDVETQSTGIVFHVNDNVRVFYNQSETFNLESPRVDNLFNVIPPQTGTTKEYGVGFQLLDNKLHMKLSFYDSDAKNATSSTSRLSVREIRNFENRFFSAAKGAKTQYGDALPDPLPEDYHIPTIAEGTDSLDDHLTPEVESIKVLPMKAMRRLDDGTVEFLDAPYFDENNDLQGRYILPDNAEATEDTNSKGFEFESTFNPNRNWRFRFNLSKLENTVTAIGPEIERYIEWRASDIYQAAFLSLREGGKESRAYLSGARGHRAAATADTLVIKRFNDLVATRLLLARDRVGRPNPGISEYNARLTAGYTVRDGFLEGLSMGTNLRWESGKAIGYYLKDVSFSLYDYLSPEEQERWGTLEDYQNLPGANGNFDDNLPFRIPDPDKTIESDPIVTGGVMVGYRRKIMDDRIDWRIQLNVQNLFKQGDDLRPIRVNPDDSIVYGINRPTTFQLTNTFSW